MAEATTVEGVMKLLPQYEEDYAKDLIASTKALTMAPSVDRPDKQVAGLSDITKGAIEQGKGVASSYQPFLTEAAQTTESAIGSMGQGMGAYNLGLGSLGGSTAQYDPSSYQAFMNPYEDAVVAQARQDAARANAQLMSRMNAQAAGSGAFGGSRATIANLENARNLQDQLNRTTSDLRMRGYTQAQTQAQNAFENQMKRQQNAAQIFGQLGAGIGSLGAATGKLGLQQAALGETQQNLGLKGVSSLLNLGAIEEGQRQAELDAQYAADYADYIDPYRRIQFGSDILRGTPSGSQTIGTRTEATPDPSVFSQLGGTALGIYGLSQTPLLGNLLK